MFLIQLLLPLTDNEGNAFAPEAFDRVRGELTDRFGGVTAFLQSPARGVWKTSEDGRTDQDQLVLVEVMTQDLNRAWWQAYRRELEARFRQESIVVRALGAQSL